MSWMNVRAKEGSSRTTPSPPTRSLRDRGSSTSWDGSLFGSEVKSSIAPPESLRALMSSLAQSTGTLEYEVSLAMSVVEALASELASASELSRAMMGELDDPASSGSLLQGADTDRLHAVWNKIMVRMKEVTVQVQRVALESDELGRLGGELGVVTPDTPYIAEALECGAILEDHLSRSEEGVADLARLEGEHGGPEHSTATNSLSAVMDRLAATLEENLTMVLGCALVDRDGRVIQSRRVHDKTAQGIATLFEVGRPAQFGDGVSRQRSSNGRSYELRRRRPAILEDSWVPLQELVVPLRRRDSGLDDDLHGYEFTMVFIVDRRRRSANTFGAGAAATVERRVATS